MVATARDQAGRETIVGVAHWVRKGAGAHEIKMDVEAESEMDSSLPPNRAADPKNEDIIERTYPHLFWQWTGA